MPPRIASSRGSTSTRGRGRGGSGASRGGPVAIAAHVQTIGVKRPGFGTGGQKIQVTVNAFEAKINNGVIFHYDAIDPEKLPARFNYKLFQTLQTQNAAQVFRDGRLVYDGRKNAFSMYKLQLGPNDTTKFPVSLTPQGPPSTRPPKVYTIKLTKVAEINTEVLHRFIAGQQSQDNTVLTSLMALNVVVRMEPNLKYPFNTRSFFTETEKKDIKAGLELWQGYFQSIRPSQNKLYVNIDISTGVFYKPINLIDLCLEFFGRNNPGDLNNIPDRERLRLQRFIANLRVQTKYAGRTRDLVVKKLTRESARTLMFNNREGVSTSVEHYFRSIGVPLRFPLLPCVEVRSGAIPIEQCTVIKGQLMRKQFPEDKTSEMVDFARKKPAERLAAIKEGLKVLQYGQSEYVRRFGLQVNPTPMNVTARILAPPKLRYGGTAQPTIVPRDGQWNMRDKKLFKPENIKKWVLVIFENPRFFNDEAVNNVISGFVQAARSVGINIHADPPLVKYARGHGNIIDQLTDAGKEAYSKDRVPPTLIVVVLPEGNTQIYTAVKYFGDVHMGVATQCLKAKKCNRGNQQYWANVMLKVNAKLGGVNNILDTSLLSDPNNPTIVMGADVIHPAPGTEGRPSFTSLVSSVDQHNAKYIAISKVQGGREEIISDLEGMVKYGLTKYMLYRKAVEKNSAAPVRLLFYRDGVSEGEFKTVLERELPKIKSACNELKINPKITLIIVGKRHHIRMFPNQPSDGDRSGNCPAGTTIDEGLGHPTEFDYYQLSHGGLIGTSRPAHYSVIHDENNFNADSLQSLSFGLTHVYARATRSVSIPAPVYYADIVCGRSKNHFPPEAGLESTEVASDAGSQMLERYKKEYKPLHENMTRNMYFM